MKRFLFFIFLPCISLYSMELQRELKPDWQWHEAEKEVANPFTLAQLFQKDRIAVGALKNMVLIYDFKKKKTRSIKNHSEPALYNQTIASNPAENQIAAVDGMGNLFLDNVDQEESYRIKINYNDEHPMMPIGRLKFSNKGKYLFGFNGSYPDDNQFFLIDARQKKFLQSILNAQQVDVSPASEEECAYSQNGAINLFDIAKNVVTMQLKGNYSTTVNSINWNNADATKLMVNYGNDNNSTDIVCWDFRNKLPQFIIHDTDTVYEIKWHPINPNYFCYGKQDFGQSGIPKGLVQLYDLRNNAKPMGSFQACVPGHIDPASSIDYQFEWITHNGEDTLGFSTNYGGFGFYNAKELRKYILDFIVGFKVLNDKKVLISQRVEKSKIATYKINE